MQFFLLSTVKQVSHIAVKLLDQNGRIKLKVSRPRDRRADVLEVERSLYAVEGDLLAFEMSTKQPPH